ncbi:MAG: Uma2 family endonuclease [Flavisolibacter sp.]|nr:Uma2 family endonuclease [Flavisolibacter sp.]
MGIANKILPYYTYKDWVHWEGQWELIEGHPFAMSPAPTPSHQRTCAKIISKLEQAVENSHCKKCQVYNFIDYKIQDDTILQPDVLVVCGEIKKKYLDFPPTLVVEILSPATALKDRHTKFELYQKQSVKYYLIVDIDKKNIEVFHLKDGKYQLETNSYQFQLEEGCRIEPNFNNIFTP